MGPSPGQRCLRRLLRSCKGDKRADVVVVRGTQGRDVAGSGVADIREIVAAPRKNLLTEACRQEIGHETRRSAIAIGEGMDRNQPVVQPDGNLVRRKRLVVYPEPDVIERRASLDRNMCGRYADIAFALSKRPGPSPDITEEPLMQAFEKRFRQQIMPSRTPCPGGPGGNIRLLGSIQVAPEGNPGLTQSHPFFRRKRCRIVRFVEQIGQSFSHKSRRRMFVRI